MKRRQDGRLDTEEQLFRYHSYNLHYVCFTCRKMFNQAPHQRRLVSTFAPVCPQCSAPMMNLGRDFKPPRQSNIKQWRKVELLARRGYRWEHYLREQNIEDDKKYWYTGIRGPKARTLREAKADYPPIK